MRNAIVHVCGDYIMRLPTEPLLRNCSNFDELVRQGERFPQRE